MPNTGHDARRRELVGERLHGEPLLRRFVLQLGMPHFGEQDQRSGLRLHCALLSGIRRVSDVHCRRVSQRVILPRHGAITHSRNGGNISQLADFWGSAQIDRPT
jgi:hypothetical protein